MKILPKLLKILLTSALFLLPGNVVQAQALVINEVLASNNHNIQDETGDYPDWIEFFNASSGDLNLEGYSVTDTRSEPRKWTFPSFSMSSGEYMLVFASGDSGTDTAYFWHTLIRRGDSWNYIIPSSEPPSSWRESGFDDSSWSTGPSGIGYGDDDDSTVISPSLSLFMRTRFDIPDKSLAGDALLQIDYDDAFVAYLNGTEIARGNMGAPGVPPPYNSPSSGLHEAVMYTGGRPESFVVAGAGALLRDGENILSIQVYNQSISSSDMSAIPYFSVELSSAPVSPAPPELGLPATTIHTGFKIDADGDTIYLFDPAGNLSDSVIITPAAPDYSFGRQPDGTGPWRIFTEPTPGGSNQTTGYISEENHVPVFSLPGGFYTAPVQLSISTGDTNDTIYYSIDGSEPDTSSLVYIVPIDLAQPAVVRARVLRAGSLPGKIVTSTFITGRKPELPVVSVTSDPGNLWDEDYGIYVKGKNAAEEAPYFGANFWQDWERPSHIEMFEPDGSQAFSIDAGIRIYGNYSRANPQKSLAVYARKVYGDKDIRYQIFPDKPIDKFESFILRNAGNDWFGENSGSGSMMRDLLAASLAGSLDQDVQAGRQAVVFLNGQYWGIQNIREKISEHFVASNHDCDPDKINLLEGNGWIINGSNQDYSDLISFIQSHPLTLDANYNYVCTKMDVDNYMKYVSTEIFIFNGDWPGNNIKFWEPEEEGGKWRWIMFDTDFGFGIWDVNKVYDNTFSFALSPDGPDWPNPPWSTFLFRSLMGNQQFKKQFLISFSDLLNTTFSSENVRKEISRLRNNISGEMVYHAQKWGSTPVQWNSTIDNFILAFANKRPDILRTYMSQMFGLGYTCQLTLSIDGPEGGIIRLNTLKPEDFPWKGVYFSNEPVHLIAEPNPGYRFKEWIGTYQSTLPDLNLSMQTDQTLVARFEKIPGASENPVVINEINYKSAPDTDSEDWVELYNSSGENTDISGWILRDDSDDHQFIIKPNTILPPDGYLVLCRDTAAFSSVYPGVMNKQGELGFGLSSSGEWVRLFTQNEILEDSVGFDITSPWPEEPNGTGYTLSLLSPELDNSLAENWAPSEQLLGTPGRENFPDEGVHAERLAGSGEGQINCYPNPFNEMLNISLHLDSPQHISLVVFDLNGRKTAVIAEGETEAGEHRFLWNAAGMPAGMYIIRFETGKSVKYYKVICGREY